jgi:hypothetical protein
MTRQVELLAQIAETLRTPARTRAAERISDAGELLSRERYERALTVAMQAIDDDPNNPAGFLAAAWASLGLDDVEQARAFFREGAQASDGDQRQSALRQAARLTFLLEDSQDALRELGDSPEQLSPAEEAATDFDRAVYFSHTGESATAAECIRKTSYHDARFCLMALTDPILSRDATVVETAAEQLRAIQEEADSIAAEFRQAHARYEAVCKEIEDLGLAEAVWKWRKTRDEQWQRTLQGYVPRLYYYGLNRFPKARANAGLAHAAVDRDEQALAERRAELVLNDALRREFPKRWLVFHRWKLHALIVKVAGWGNTNGREVRLDPGGKVISTNVRSKVGTLGEGGRFYETSGGTRFVAGGYSEALSEYTTCQYCGSNLKEYRVDCSNCFGTHGELELLFREPYSP